MTTFRVRTQKLKGKNGYLSDRVGSGIFDLEGHGGPVRRGTPSKEMGRRRVSTRDRPRLTGSTEISIPDVLDFLNAGAFSARMNLT